MKQRVLVIKPNITYQFLKVKVKDGMLQFPKRVQEAHVHCVPTRILREDKPAWVFWRSPKTLIIHYQGSLETAQVFPKEHENFQMAYLTLNDVLKAVKSQIVKALTTFKPLARNEFLILMGLGVINIIAIGYLAFKIGVI